MKIYKTDNFSSAHLSSDELSRFHRHLVTEAERIVIEKHLDECELCSDAMNGMSVMNDDIQMYKITHDLKKRMRSRQSVRKKVFSGIDLVTILLILFIIGLVVFIAFYFIIAKTF